MSQTPACPDVPDALVLAYKSRSFARRLRAGDLGDIRPEPADYDELAGVIEELVGALALATARQSRALPSTALAARPEEGWKLVPTHATEAMTDAVMAEGFPCYPKHLEGIYRCMIKAAPSTPPAAGDGHD